MGKARGRSGIDLRREQGGKGFPTGEAFAGLAEAATVSTFAQETP